MESLFKRVIGECQFKTSRSSGKGGQHVNKVETRVVVSFDVENSYVLTNEQKQRLYHKLGARLSGGRLMVACEETRSQARNKALALDKLKALIIKGLSVNRKRVATKPTRASKQKRRESKKRQSLKKQSRRKVDPD